MISRGYDNQLTNKLIYLAGLRTDENNTFHYNNELSMLTCQNGNCSWTDLGMDFY